MSSVVYVNTAIIGRVALGVIHRLQLDVDVAVVVVRRPWRRWTRHRPTSAEMESLSMTSFNGNAKRPSRDVRVHRLAVFAFVLPLDQVQRDVANLVDARRHRIRRFLVQRQVQPSSLDP